MRFLFLVTTLSLGFFCILGVNHLEAQTFRSMDKALDQPKDVKILDLSGKNLKSFPENIHKFKNLEEIDLSPEQMLLFGGSSPQVINGNYIQKLPEEIGKLRNLRSLNLQATDLRTLPFGMVNLEKLSYLDLSYNSQLNSKTVMLIIPKLPGLRFLDLSGCPISSDEIQELQGKLPHLVIQYWLFAKTFSGKSR